jgi:hypothetical protein
VGRIFYEILKLELMPFQAPLRPESSSRPQISLDFESQTLTCHMPRMILVFATP